MNKSDLRRLLIEQGVSPEHFNLEGKGPTDERFCLISEGAMWNVFFCERGLRTTNEQFATEDEACQFIYEQMI